MTSFRGSIVMVVLATILAVAPTASVFAQDVRSNPFLPTSTEEERQILAEKERMRQAIREMMPEIRTMLLPVFEEQKTALMEEIKTAAPAPAEGAAADATVAATAAAGAPAEGAGLTLPGTNIPATAKFVACINGKALYRDANGTKYFDENASTTCPQ